MERAKQSVQLSGAIKKFSFGLVMFLFAFVTFRTPLADILKTNAIKAIPDILVLGLAVWYLIEIRMRLKFKVHDVLFLAFLAEAFVSTVFINHVGIMPFVFQVRSIGIYYILYYVVRNMGFGKDEYIKLTRLLQVMAVILFVFAVIEKVTSKTVLFSQEFADSIIYADNFARAYSLFYNPNTYGMFLAVTLFMSLYIGFFCEAKTNAFIYIVIAVSVYLSMSRSTILIIAIGGALFVLQLFLSGKMQKEYKCVLKTAVIVALCASVLSFVAVKATDAYYDAYIANSSSLSEHHQSIAGNSNKVSTGDRLDEMNDDKTITASQTDGRIYSVKTGLLVFKDHPVFGAGFGTYGSAASLNFPSPIYEQYNIRSTFYADNEYIKVVAENGALGVLLFGAFLISILVCYRRDRFKLLICLVIGWYGIFYNIFEVQIGALALWTVLSFEDRNLYGKSAKKSAEESSAE